MSNSKDFAEEEVKVSPMEEIPPTDDPILPVNPPEVEPLIFVHAHPY
jgi:hypothetical protein